jgi:aconitase A
LPHHELYQHEQPSVMIAAGLLAKKAVEKGLGSTRP